MVPVFYALSTILSIRGNDENSFLSVKVTEHRTREKRQIFTVINMHPTFCIFQEDGLHSRKRI